jgi:L-threonylcarbamoyladenylate synthase
MPTETVYGLAADASNAYAVARLFEAKGRPRFNPLIAHVADRAMARKVAMFDDRAEALAEKFWPGPLTLVLPLRDETLSCDLARAGLSTIAVRAPSHPTAHELIGAFGRPVVAPSANRSGRPSPTTFEDAMEETGVSAQAWLDGGACEVGIESTVVAVLDGGVRWLRPGVVTRDEVAAVSGPLAEAGGDAGRSPGRLALHYAPNAPVRIDAESPEAGEAYLAFGKTDAAGPLVWNLSASGDLREAATNLFRMLREADRAQPEAIAVAPIPDQGLGEALNDRLRRASGHVG